VQGISGALIFALFCIIFDWIAMPEWLTTLLHYFSLPEIGLTAVFVVSFLSATFLPLATEPVLFGYIKLNFDQFWWAIGVATLGNTIGGMLTYWMGYGAKSAYIHRHTDHQPKHFLWLQRIGAPILLLSWLPVVGDALCAMAGWAKLPWRGVLLYMGVGKFIRFVAMTFALLWIPADFWHKIASFLPF
jgi:membrane protein YqaA with SNARE-associated domain